MRTCKQSHGDGRLGEEESEQVGGRNTKNIRATERSRHLIFLSSFCLGKLKEDDCENGAEIGNQPTFKNFLLLLCV